MNLSCRTYLNSPTRSTLSGQGLLDMARAAQHLGCEYHWLDLVCVNQQSKEEIADQEHCKYLPQCEGSASDVWRMSGCTRFGSTCIMD